MILVFDASPLIVLSKAGLIDAVTGLADRVIVPSPVADELLRFSDPMDAAVLWQASRKGRSLVEAAPSASPFLAAWDLGAGETSVLSVAAGTEKSMAVLDDLAARRCAKAMGVPVTGTIGLLVMSKRSGAIQSLAESLSAVESVGLYLSTRLRDSALRAAGE